MLRPGLLSLSLMALTACGSVATLGSPAVHAESAPVVGQPAPTFALTDTDGRTVKLADLLGKNVVIEWFNPDCPFIVAAHKGGPLETLPQEWVDRGGVRPSRACSRG